MNPSRSSSAISSRVRHRHSSDWQRRLRSFVGESQSRSLSPVDNNHVNSVSLQPEEEVTNSFEPVLSSETSDQARNDNVSHSLMNRNDGDEEWNDSDRNNFFGSEVRVPLLDNTDDDGAIYEGLESDDEVLDLAPGYYYYFFLYYVEFLVIRSDCSSLKSEIRYE